MADAAPTDPARKGTLNTIAMIRPPDKNNNIAQAGRGWRGMRAKEASLTKSAYFCPAHKTEPKSGRIERATEQSKFYRTGQPKRSNVNKSIGFKLPDRSIPS